MSRLPSSLHSRAGSLAAVKSRFDLMKQFSIFAALAAASGG
jgi:hypothetical protein